jgi:hypothetical protein
MALDANRPPALAADYLEDLLSRTEGIGPKPERVSEAYADERIREKIARFPEEKQQAGLWSINQTLKAHEVPPALRLHLVTAVVNLSRVAEASLEGRRERAG